MSDVTIQWFREQVKTLPSVRNVHPILDSEADLIIRTWVGMNVKVYFLDGVPNMRAIKRVIGENTRSYQGTIFIVRHELMPPDKKRLVPDEWMQALHELNSERVYTYIPDHKSLYQVHLDYLPDGAEREAWHGDPVTFTKLRVLNVSARSRSIRGQWMMADFGANPYWKTSNMRAERLKMRYEGRGTRTYNYTWNQYDAGGGPGGASRESLQQAHLSELERSLNTLGVEMGATQDEVKSAFRKLAREFHPDVSTLDKEDAERRFREINLAYEYIKTTRKWS